MNSLHLKQALIIALTLTTAPILWAKNENHSAHVHGSAKLSIALENTKEITLLLEAPGDSIFGFEHEAKNPRDKKAQQSALNSLKNEMNDLFIFEKAASCTISKNKIEVSQEEGDHQENKNEKKHKHHEEKHGEHNEVEAEYNVNCQKKPSTLEIKIGTKFPKIKTLQVQLLKEEGQNSVELKDAKGTLQI